MGEIDLSLFIMIFAAHGKYELSLTGEVIIARLYQTWNLECVTVFFNEYKSLVLDNAFKKFGVVSDLRQFEGGPPEVLACFKEMAEWAKAHGLIARAQLSDSEWIVNMIHQPSQEKQLFSIKTFDDEGMALGWMADQGLNIGKTV